MQSNRQQEVKKVIKPGDEQLSKFYKDVDNDFYNALKDSDYNLYRYV